jgi:hypothetical protein
LTFACDTACSTSLMPTPRAASAFGSICTRTAYFLLTEHLHLRHAVDGGDALREVGLGVFVDRRERQARSR